MTAMLTKSRKVLDLMGLEGDLVRYSREPDDESDIPAVVSLRRVDYVDFGGPDQITVTIEPGDLLSFRG